MNQPKLSLSMTVLFNMHVPKSVVTFLLQLYQRQYGVSIVERTKVLVELWILTYNVPSDTHEVVKHMITIENTFAWYGE